MADTIREQIISAYETQLASWKTSNGYNIGCGANVFRAVQHVDPDALPAVVINPRSEEVIQRYGVNVCEMVLQINAFAEIGTTNPSVIQEQLLGDAIKNMSGAVSTKTKSVIYKAGGPAQVPTDEDTITAVFAEFTVTYNTLAGDPYSQ